MEKPAHSAAPRRHQLQPGEPACSYQNTWSWDSHSHTATPVILSPKSIPGFSLRTRLTAKLTSVTQHLPSLPVLQAPGKGILPGMCPVRVRHLHPLAHLCREKLFTQDSDLLSGISKRDSGTSRGQTVPAGQEWLGRLRSPRPAGCTCASCQSSSTPLIRLCNRFEK